MQGWLQGGVKMGGYRVLFGRSISSDFPLAMFAVRSPGRYGAMFVYPGAQHRGKWAYVVLQYHPRARSASRRICCGYTFGKSRCARSAPIVFENPKGPSMSMGGDPPWMLESHMGGGV